MTIHMLGVEYPDLRAALHRLSTQPSVRARLTVPGIAGGVPIHGARLARAMRVLPRTWIAAIEADVDDDTLRLVISWDTPSHRGRLRLRALGAIQLGEIASATLDTCNRYAHQQISHYLSRSEIAATSRALGGAYRCYGRTGRDLRDSLIAYGWRHYTDAPIT